MKWLLLVAAFTLSAAVRAEDKKDGPVKLSIVAKKDKYPFDGGGKTPAEYKKALEAAAKDQKDGKLTTPPKPPSVDLVLVLTNTSKEDVTVYVAGDANAYTFELTGGDGVTTLYSGLVMTREFRASKAVKIAAGKAHEIPVKQLSDGVRGLSRYVYWTGPGEYKLSAKYTLATDENGGRGKELTSEPVKITVTEK